MNKHVVILIYFLICQPYLYAQDDAIFTDRPGQTDAVYTMGKGYFQVEQIWDISDVQKGEMFESFVKNSLIVKVG